MIKMDISLLCKKLWDFEQKHDLFNVKIKDIYIWKLIRFSIFKSLSQEVGGYSQAHTSKNTTTDKIIAVKDLVKYSIAKNPMSGSYKLEYLIFDHQRKMNINGEMIDIYTNDFINSLSEENYEVIESPYLWMHYSNHSQNVKYIDHMIITNFVKKKVKPLKLSVDEENLINCLEKEINSMFATNINLNTLIYNKVNNFYYKYHYFYKLLKKRSPKKVYLVVSYGKEELIAAAKDLNIEVIEFQHGVITDYHFAYNFADPDEYVPYFPDKILTFGEYWAKTKGFPKQTEIEVYGFPYLEQQLEQYKNVKKKESQILFLSQGTIGKELSKFAKNVAEQMPDYHFIYKLHPGEYDRWKDEYPELIDAQKLPNFEIVDNNDVNLYQWFAESEFQVGVYSTAIFEGLTLGCKTVLVDLPGIEYVQDLIDKQYVLKAKSVSELKYKIENHQVKNFDKDHFFKTNN